MLEKELSKTGSTKTAAQLKEDLDELSAKLWVHLHQESCLLNIKARRKNQRDRNNLIDEKERQNNSHRQIENELHAMEVREYDLQSKLKERKLHEGTLESLQREIATNTALVEVGHQTPLFCSWWS